MGAVARRAAAAALLLSALSCKPKEFAPREFVYGRAGGRDLSLGLSAPEAGKGPFPAVVFVFGGGWRAGSRHDMDHFVTGMARLGYVGVAVDYRLVPSARFPAQVEDVEAAVRWLRENAPAHRIDPARIGVVGFSAGAHLACMLGVEGAAQAVVSFFGPTDFTARDFPRDLEKEVLEPFLGGTFAERPEVYREASPLAHVTRGAPPFLFFHGAKDELIPVDQSRRMAERLTQAGASAEIVVFPEEGHGFTDATNQRAMKRMLEFLDGHLKKGAAKAAPP